MKYILQFQNTFFNIIIHLQASAVHKNHLECYNFQANGVRKIRGSFTIHKYEYTYHQRGYQNLVIPVLHLNTLYNPYKLFDHITSHTLYFQQIELPLLMDHTVCLLEVPVAHSYLYLQDTNKKVIQITEIQITANIPTKRYKNVKLEKYRTVVTTLVQYFLPFIDFYDF